jgi:REP element-mobilizing transposase RayT
MAKQLALSLPRWGGRRKGAGRPRTRAHPELKGPGVPHLKRSALAARHPVHVTLRVLSGVGYLRAWSRTRLLETAFHEARLRFGMRIVHYSIQGNHLHLIVEAESALALARGMQGLATRIARRLNVLAARRGAVFVDRYHSHALRTRREVANAIRYVLGNYRHHTREYLPARWSDPGSSARFLGIAPAEDAPVAEPKTWLLRVGWKGRSNDDRAGGHPRDDRLAADNRRTLLFEW